MDLGYLFGIISYFLLIVSIQGSTVSDPCPVDAEIREISVTMCTDGYATEKDHFDAINVDSVVLRVIQQQSNCVCLASLINQTQQTYLYVRPYGGYDNSVPSSSNCGVNIDISRTNKLEEQSESIATIGCIQTEYLNKGLPINVGEDLKLTSKVTEGAFEQGFCLHLYRVYRSNNNFLIQIKCFGYTITDATTDGLTQGQIFSFQPTHQFLSTSLQPLTPVSNDCVNESLEAANHESSSSTFKALTGVFAATSVIFIVLFISVLILYRRIRSSIQKRNQKPTQQCTYDNLQSGRDNSSSTYSSISTAVSDREQYEFVGGI